MRMRFLAAAAAMLLSATAASAQTWPSRPVTLVVPFTAGTTSDVIARGLIEHLATKLGQPFIIDNRGGAGGNIGGAAAAKAAPDGYTFLFATTGPAATNKLMYKDMSYDPDRDFAPVVLIGKAPVIVVAKKDAPFSTLKEMIDYAKANPDKLTAGFPGNGTLGHITGELLQARAGIKLVDTQYRGSPPIITDLIGGHIDVGMDSMAAYVPTVKDGKIKALAIAGGKRWSKLPDVPTASESGLRGFEAAVWYVILAPTGTPADVIAKLNAATNEYIKSEKARTFFDNLGVEASGGTPADAKAFMASEVEKWAPIIKAAKISF
ncbi:MAG: tripartite tricarboxylate transporter substrate binding protein [Rhizobiales bacterium]|nr:tripartite tricarboxylate transporter substrate binding protein [Hyphomicrobiales bacterium]